MIKKLKVLFTLLIVSAFVLAACGTDDVSVVETVVAPDTGDEPEDEAEEEMDMTDEEMEEMEVVRTERRGGWLDSITMVLVTAETAITQIEAGAVDIYASDLSTANDIIAIGEAGLEKSQQFGIYYELTFNPAGDPTFEATGTLNPFSNNKIREAMNWLIDRDFINQEIYGGNAVPKYFSLVSGFPDYARHVDIIRALELKYAYDPDRAAAVITAEMEGMGAELVDGVWNYEGEVIDVIFLIRNDSDGTRIPIGNYISNQLEDIGFFITRDERTSSEASALWIGGDPNDGEWHLYTGAWGSSAISRDDGGDFQFFMTPASVYGSIPLWQEYEQSDEFLACSEALANNTFDNMDERRDLFSTCLDLSFEQSYRVWIADGRSSATWNPAVGVSYDLSSGVDSSFMTPFTIRFDDVEGGDLNWGTPDLFVDPPNPVQGSNWVYDAQWQNATQDNGLLPNPHTGLAMPQRYQSAAVTIETGLPVGVTLDWLSLDFADTIDVPADAMLDWDVETETWISAGDGTTARRKVVVVFEDSLFDIKWHDGSQFSTADVMMTMIVGFAIGMEGSPIYDEAAAPSLDSFKATFKGWKITSESPLTIEWYSDTYFLDAEDNVPDLWPDYGYGDGAWHMMAVANLAEAAGDLAYSADKADAGEIEWMSFIGGPSLDILAGHLDDAAASSLIPFEATMGAYVTADDADARYANLAAWYAEHGHFWVGTGPYYLDQVFLVEKTLTLKQNADFADLSDEWSGFATPKIAEATIDGPGRVTIGAEATFDVFVEFEGAAYPSEEVIEVKYLLFDASGEIVEVGSAVFVAEGVYSFTLSAEATALLSSGAGKIEVAVVVVPVSIPAFATFEFVAE